MGLFSVIIWLFHEIQTIYHIILSPIRGITHKERLESFYAGQAKNYDSYRKKLLACREILLDKLPRDGIWVDMGGGTGFNIEYMAKPDRLKYYKKVYLVDLSPSLLQIANHVPLVDIDGDRFGTESTFRGSSWRGKDCNDLSSKIRPGARSVKGDFVIDHNCNGIFGMDSSTNRPWEDELCNDTQQIGVAILGDSVSAHFHIPEQWLDASQASSSVFEHMLFIIENELDWPQLSGSTGYLNISWPNIAGPTRSTYARFFERDHCNHRDYQNIAVNGARSLSMINISKTLTRDPENDVPLLVFYALVGNDVCNGYPNTIDHMTTVEEMRTNILTVLTYLDTILPKGSHLLTTGLANGSLLYELLHNRIHPLGRVGTPVTYAQFYTYLSCLQVSPCNGWLTTNDTLRAFTSQRAVDLSEAIRNVTLEYSPKNFDLDYFYVSVADVFAAWIAQGGEPWQLVESVDGFHINQYGHALISDFTWTWLEKNKPHWLPQWNPHNADIERIFKDQGGY
ncbi:unnamed protein product [Rotaria sp. Silwood1]|nr:unnamed protein product [Rotaria sp. Silwood1]